MLTLTHSTLNLHASNTLYFNIVSLKLHKLNLIFKLICTDNILLNIIYEFDINVFTFFSYIAAIPPGLIFILPEANSLEVPLMKIC